MSDDEHPELDFDPLDDTKTWPEDQFPLRPVGMMTLNRNVKNNFAENEQIAFGTGVLVDGLDFSDDKMLIGRTFSYSDTQRYRVGPNYLQLPVNRPHPDVRVSTNQRDGAMTYFVDGTRENPHINFEPSWKGGLTEAETGGPSDEPYYAAKKVKQTIDRRNDYGQVGKRWREDMDDFERDDLVLNLTTLLGQCDVDIQQQMVGNFLRCDEEYGSRVAQGLGVDLDDARKAVEEVDRFIAEREQRHTGRS